MAYAMKNNLPVKMKRKKVSIERCEAFLRREYNEEMNTYENSAEVWKYIYHQLAKQDEVWQESYDYCFQMSDWLHTPELLYSTLVFKLLLIFTYGFHNTLNGMDATT